VVSWLVRCGLAVLWIAGSHIAAAQVLTDLELGAGYCLGMMKFGGIQAQGVLAGTGPECEAHSESRSIRGCHAAQQFSADRQEQHDIERLEAYLAARGFIGSDFRATSILAAIQRGQADAVHWNGMMQGPQVQACLSSCPLLSPTTDPSLQCKQQCWDKADTDGYIPKATHCFELVKTLPF
jgi:hypothetical protein